MKERLQKLLSEAGICSRRKAEKEIAEGRVKVNGVTAKIGDSADPKQDRIFFNGMEILFKEKPHRYLMLNKPVGVVTTMRDEKGRKCVSDLVQCGTRVYPVGRLDFASEGLLLMTDDGELANQLMHPSHHVDKTYLVEVQGKQEKIAGLEKEMDIDGYRIRSAKVKILKRLSEDCFLLQLTIHEGRNRQIRKMCQQCGFKVLGLQRIAIGNLHLDSTLEPGQWRDLTRKERESFLNKTVKKNR